MGQHPNSFSTPSLVKRRGYLILFFGKVIPSEKIFLFLSLPELCEKEVSVACPEFISAVNYLPGNAYSHRI